MFWNLCRLFVFLFMWPVVFACIYRQCATSRKSIHIHVIGDSIDDWPLCRWYTSSSWWHVHFEDVIVRPLSVLHLSCVLIWLKLVAGAVCFECIKLRLPGVPSRLASASYLKVHFVVTLAYLLLWDIPMPAPREQTSRFSLRHVPWHCLQSEVHNYM